MPLNLSQLLFFVAGRSAVLISYVFFMPPPGGVRSGSSMSANPIADKKAVHYLAVTNGGP